MSVRTMKLSGNMVLDQGKQELINSSSNLLQHIQKVYSWIILEVNNKTKG